MMREQFGDEGKDLTFVLMNSFSTSDDTKAYLAKYEPSVGPVDDLEFVQNKSPKVTSIEAGVESERQRESLSAQNPEFRQGCVRDGWAHRWMLPVCCLSNGQRIQRWNGALLDTATFTLR